MTKTEKERMCSNCKFRRYEYCGDYGYCMDYEISNDIRETAKNCILYEYQNPDVEDDDYMPSATAGDYSPTCPWNAPGMSISDFI